MLMRKHLGPDALQALTGSGPHERSALQMLSDAHLSMTVPRLGVIQALNSAPEAAMAAEDIFKALMGSDTPVSVATVYRVLKELEQHGMVRRHLRRSLNGAKSVYQLAAGAEPASGARLRCTCCGRSVALDAQALAKAVEPIAGKSGFALGAGSIQIEATCAECAESGRPDTPARN